MDQPSIERVLLQNVWRIYLLPHGDKPKNEFGFCYQRDIIGIGWQVCEEPTDLVPTDIDEYLERVRAKYEPGDGSGWKEASEAISRDMSKGDLVWARNHRTDRLYLGKISGDWEYRNGDEYQCADIVSVRPCRLYEVRSNDVGKDAADFFQTMKAEKFRRGHTVEPIEDEGLKHRTIKIWDKIQRKIKSNR